MIQNETQTDSISSQEYPELEPITNLTNDNIPVTPPFCWICRDKMDNDDDDFENQWVSPCDCEGIRKYSHQKCLLTFIVNNKYINPQWDSRCNWCKLPYLITVDEPSIFYKVQYYCDRILNHMSPWLFSTGMFISLATLSYYYSDLLLYFMDAQKEFDELFYDLGFFSRGSNFICLPLSLIIFESYNWEHSIATMIIKRMIKSKGSNNLSLKIMEEIFGQNLFYSGNSNSIENQPTNLHQLPYNVNINKLDVYPKRKRNIIGYILTGLVMPFVSYTFGSIFFPYINHNILRTSMGWMCLHTIRGCFRLAYQVHALDFVTSIKVYNRDHHTISSSSNVIP